MQGLTLRSSGTHRMCRILNVERTLFATLTGAYGSAAALQLCPVLGNVLTRRNVANVLITVSQGRAPIRRLVFLSSRR